MRYIYLFIIAMGTVFSLLSCGTVQSVSSIVDADKRRHKALKIMTVAFKDESMVIQDEYGNKFLDPEAGEKMMPFEVRETAYYFHLAEAYLQKARDMQSKSQHEIARELAEKSERFLKKSIAISKKFMNSPIKLYYGEISEEQLKYYKPDRDNSSLKKPASSTHKTMDIELEKKTKPSVPSPPQQNMEKGQSPSSEKQSDQKEQDSKKEKAEKKEKDKKEEKPEKKDRYMELYERLRKKALEKKNEKDESSSSEGGAQ